jgi:hypothetical protein
MDDPGVISSAAGRIPWHPSFEPSTWASATRAIIRKRCRLHRRHKKDQRVDMAYLIPYLSVKSRPSPQSGSIEKHFVPLGAQRELNFGCYAFVGSRV